MTNRPHSRDKRVVDKRVEVKKQSINEKGNRSKKSFLGSILGLFKKR